MLVIGKNPIYEILKTNPIELNKIVVLKTLQPEKKSKEIVKLAKENNIKVLFLNKFDFANYFNRKNKDEGISQGFIGFVKDYEYSSLKDIIENCKDVKYPLILLLDEITDPHNLGAIIRSAVCLEANGIVIPKHNSAEVNHTVMKTSSGAVNYIKIAKETNLSNSIEYLKKNNFWIVGTDVSTDKFIYEVDFKMPIALIIGSEGSGIRKSIKDKCDLLAKIPMSGLINSLNASVSTGITLYEILRQKLNMR